MSKLQYLLFFVFLPQSLFAQSQDLQEYFFPLKKLCKTKVYQFEVAEKPELTQYWKMKAKEKSDGWELVTQVYNADFRILEYSIEQIDTMGSTLLSFIQFDEKGKADTVDLVEHEVFRWQQQTDETVRWSILMNNASNETVFFAKERTLLKDCNPPTYKGRKYDAICFKDAFHSVNSDTYEELFTFIQTSYYANDLGLIGFDRVFEYSPEQNANYRLVKVLKEKKWKKLRK